MSKRQFNNDNLQEVFSETNADKWKKHIAFIDNLEERGYNVLSEDKEEETGFDNEMISVTLTTVLEPPNTDLPELKFVAQETFGHYDYDKKAFDEWDEPRFSLKSYKKGSKIENFNDRWEALEMPEI